MEGQERKELYICAVDGIALRENQEKGRRSCIFDPATLPPEVQRKKRPQDKWCLCPSHGTECKEFADLCKKAEREYLRSDYRYFKMCREILVNTRVKEEMKLTIVKYGKTDPELCNQIQSGLVRKYYDKKSLPVTSEGDKEFIKFLQQPHPCHILGCDGTIDQDGKCSKGVRPKQKCALCGPRSWTDFHGVCPRAPRPPWHPCDHEGCEEKTNDHGLCRKKPQGVIPEDCRICEQKQDDHAICPNQFTVHPVTCPTHKSSNDHGVCFRCMTDSFKEAGEENHSRHADHSMATDRCPICTSTTGCDCFATHSLAHSHLHANRFFPVSRLSSMVSHF
ncbi:hypothetical protein T439DRAFT_179612 [Meredithblackwellia eburnea MCA 4105]